MSKIKATFAHLFQRVTRNDGAGFIIGTMTFDRASSAWLVEGAEYMFGFVGGQLWLGGECIQSDKPEEYDQSDINSLLRQQIWTGIENRGFMGCRLIPLSGNDHLQDFLFYGAFKHPPFVDDSASDCFFALTSDGFSKIAPPAPTVGENANTLLRLPFWRLGTHAGKSFAIEPTATTLFNEQEIARKLKIQFFDGAISETDIQSFAESNKVVNRDIFSVKGYGFDRELYACLSFLSAQGRYEGYERITDAATCQQRSAAMKDAIAATMAAAGGHRFPHVS